MNEYSVTVLVDASRNYTVKAESPEAAVEQAEERYSRESSTLCHQCSGKLDVGGAVGAIVYCEDKEVLDTGYQAARIATLEAECEGLRKQVAATLDVQRLREALLVALEVLGGVEGNINPERDFASELEEEISTAADTARAALAVSFAKEEV